MRLIAHRGRCGSDPENSRAGFSGLLRHLGNSISGIEIDVRVSSDGVPILLHDAELQRTTNGHGEVSSTPLEKLKTLRLHGADEPPPTLSDYLKLAAPVLWPSEHMLNGIGAATMFLDIKTSACSEVALIACEIAKLPFAGGIVCLGKTHRTLETLFQYGQGKLRLGLLRCNHENLDENLAVARQFRAEVLFVQHRLTAFLENAETVPEIREAGFQAGGSILNGDAALDVARKAGCDLVLTDIP